LNRKLLAIAGSPRHGNSDALLDAFCAGAKQAGLDITRLAVRDLKFSGCLACGGCDLTGECILDDDMRLVYRAFREHPLLVVAATIHFAGLPGQLKNLVDRFQCAWVAKYRLKRPWFAKASGRQGYFLCVSALHRQDAYEHARAPLQTLFITLNYTDGGGTYFPGYDEAGAVLANPRALELARQAGAAFAPGSSPTGE